MTFNSLNHLIHHTRERFARLGRQTAGQAMRRPGVAAGILLAAGTLFGAGVGFAGTHHADSQQAQLDATRTQAQRELNALAARLGELQAEANRLNALGERLTRTGQLADGEFDFDKPIGVGGVGPTRDMAPSELRGGLDQLESQFKASGEQLSVLESLLFNRKLDQEATPSRMPIADSYVTSGFGGRADPFGGGAAFHKGMDFHANTGDPVLAVADGVVSYAGVRSGYGNVVEIDHGNGYMTRYAHNRKNLVRVGQRVHAGEEIAFVGETGRATGPHCHFEVWLRGKPVNPLAYVNSVIKKI